VVILEASVHQKEAYTSEIPRTALNFNPQPLYFYYKQTTLRNANKPAAQLPQLQLNILALDPSPVEGATVSSVAFAKVPSELALATSPPIPLLM
jgi:hypothetical protein